MTALPKIPRPATLIALATLAALAVLSAAYAQSGTATTFTDKRDGKTYRTAVIGKQRWMAENLNFKTERSVCYDNKESNCKKYGRLYDWDDAMTACPAGWHLPSDDEWDDLAKAVGGVRRENMDGSYYYWKDAGKKLKSKSDWGNNSNGTDDYGFSALPGGFRWSDGSFDYAGVSGVWWSATEYNATSAWYRDMLSIETAVGSYGHDKTSLFSLRCLLDVAAPQ